jgi:hypothetical protein
MASTMAVGAALMLTLALASSAPATPIIPLPGCGPPHADAQIAGATLRVLNSTSLEACGVACVADSECIALSWTALNGGVCTLSGWSPLYVVEATSQDGAVYYTRELARNDTRVPASGVALLVSVPTSGVHLGPG